MVPQKITGEGVGIVEAMRGTLTHHYTCDEKGICTSANLIVGTTNNNAPIQMVTKKVAQALIKPGEEPDQGILNMIEMAFRAFDPCYSCATHSLPGQMPLEIRDLARAASGQAPVRAMKTLLLGMGNPILSDDAVGVRLAADIGDRLLGRPASTVRADCSVGGLELLDVLAGYARVIVLDSIRTAGGVPGRLVRLRRRGAPRDHAPDQRARRQLRDRARAGTSPGHPSARRRRRSTSSRSRWRTSPPSRSG